MTAAKTVVGTKCLQLICTCNSSHFSAVGCYWQRNFCHVRCSCTWNSDTTTFGKLAYGRW